MFSSVTCKLLFKKIIESMKNILGTQIGDKLSIFLVNFTNN